MVLHQRLHPWELIERSRRRSKLEDDTWRGRSTLCRTDLTQSSRRHSRREYQAKLLGGRLALNPIAGRRYADTSLPTGFDQRSVTDRTTRFLPGSVPPLPREPPENAARWLVEGSQRRGNPFSDLR